MTYPADDPEYIQTFHDLIMGRAEEIRQEHEELVAAGFTVRQVVGQAALIYERNGRLFTKDAALAQSWIIREHKEDSGG